MTALNLFSHVSSWPSLARCLGFSWEENSAAWGTARLCKDEAGYDMLAFLNPGWLNVSPAAPMAAGCAGSARSQTQLKKTDYSSFLPIQDHSNVHSHGDPVEVLTFCGFPLGSPVSCLTTYTRKMHIKCFKKKKNKKPPSTAFGLLWKDKTRSE